jgi:serine/threonine-protein kinase
MAGSLQIHHYFSPTDISYTPSLLWSYDLDSSAEFPSEPAIGYGNAYIYADNGILSCVDLDTGLPVWSQQVSGSSYHTPALGDGNVYVCTSEGVFAFEAATGTYQWSYTTGTYSMTDPMTIEGAVYCAGDRVVSLDAASGTLLWDYGLPSPAWTSPSAGTSNTLSGFLPALLVATQSQMFVFNMETGAVEYTIPVMNPTNITCLFDLWFVNSEGGIVEFTNSGNVNAIAKSSDPWVTYASSTAADSYVSYYYYSSDGNLYNYSVGGVKQWESTVGEVLDYGPVLGNNFVYLSFRDGTIRAFYRATGMQKWSLQLDYLSDFCIAHGKLYAVSGGYLQCYG